MNPPELSCLLAARAPAAPLALARIVAALAALLHVSPSWHVLDQLVQPITLRLPYVAGMPTLTAMAVPVVLGIWLVAGLLFMLGWRTRWTGSLLAAILLAVVLFYEQTYSNHLYLLGLVVTLLVLSNSGAVFSLDARRRGPETQCRRGQCSYSECNCRSSMASRRSQS